MKTGIFLTALLALGIGLPAHAATSRPQSDGYALLFGLSEKEKRANLIFIVKDAGDKVQATTKKISKLYGRIDDELQAWARDDKTIDLKTAHLPAVEIAARDAIEKAHTGELMGRKGPAFEHLFLILQWQSLYYGYNLTQTLLNAEEKPDRQKALRQDAKELRRLIDEVYAQT